MGDYLEELWDLHSSETDSAAVLPASEKGLVTDTIH